MLGRNFYTKSNYSDLDQGSVIAGCVANNYENCKVCGVIITPRCDISNNKVVTYHYLPIVQLTDWILRDYWIFGRKSILKSAESKLTKLLLKYKVDIESVLILKDEKYLNEYLEKMNVKSKNERVIILDEWSFLKNLMSNSDIPVDNQYFSSIKDKIKGEIKTVTKELVKGRRGAYYLIEDWEKENSFRVILLREIKTILSEVGQRIPEGVIAKELSEEDSRRCDLDYGQNDLIVSSPVRINSPFIEHLMQSFFFNFGRIGVADFDNQTEEKILEHLENIWA